MYRVGQLVIVMFGVMSMVQAKDSKAEPELGMHWQPDNTWQFSVFGGVNREQSFSLSNTTKEKSPTSVIQFKAKDSSSIFSVSYPDIPEIDRGYEKKEVSTFLDNWQELTDNRYIPKDLIPYVGIRMNYKISKNFSLFNDITMQNLVYGFRYKY